MQLPMPLRAAVGLAAEAVENARHLPDRAIELPMLAVSTALQMSLRAQQRYAMLAARGDEVLNRREPGEEPPPWATFDDDLSGEPAAGPGGDLGEFGGDLGGGLPTDLTADFGSPGNGDGGATRPPGTKAVNRPRNGPPSRFDAIGDE